MTKEQIITCLMISICATGATILFFIERKMIRKLEALRFIQTLKSEDFKPWMNSKGGTRILLEVVKDLNEMERAQ